ncbi:MAG: L-threonylcarbamoyladenylate synthase [Chitinophagales bacterium]|jgi:L-threonylcarbamoyladenylate synthase|nr:threonylcarbamoyl-AMP synthase [Sphingobacteriales bacterium]
MQTQIGLDLDKAAQLLIEGELVAIPTETVYGLAANALSAEAVSKIYQVKNRPQFNPLILHVANLFELKKYVLNLPKKVELLIQKFSPGPLTVLLPKSELVSDLVTAGSSNVAIRIPNHPLTLDLLNRLDFPLAAPSANISGTVSPTSAEHVFEQLNDKIPYILDGGETSIGIESTIVGYDDRSEEITIHRLGGLSIEEMEACIHEKIRVDIHHDQPTTPGQLKSHYATQTPLLVGNIDELIKDKNSKEIVIINYHQLKEYEVKKQFVLSNHNSSAEAAQNLFKIMREADKCQAQYILCEWAPEEGLGLAINDRLERASYTM